MDKTMIKKQTLQCMQGRNFGSVIIVYKHWPATWEFITWTIELFVK